MARPKVDHENHEAVYRFYETHEQNRAFAHFAHRVFARMFKVSITSEPGVADEIDRAIAEGTRIIISPNHLTGDDQYVIVAFAQAFKPLHPLRARTFIPAEPSLFRRSGLKGKFLRWAVDELGALPTFRLEDFRRRNIEITDEIVEIHRAATVGASDTQVAKLKAGHMMAGFWEGTRNRTDYRVVQPLKKGMAYTAIAAAESHKVAILPVGLSYGGEPEDYAKPVLPGKRAPYIHFGRLIPVETTDAAELTAQVQPAIQHCVDVVVARAAQQHDTADSAPSAPVASLADAAPAPSADADATADLSGLHVDAERFDQTA